LRRLIFLSLLLGAPLLVSAQTKPPASQPATSRYTNAEHKIEWPLLDDKRWSLTANPQAGVLAIIKHQEEMGGAHPMVMLSFDRLPKEVTTAASYAETNVSLLPKYGFSEIKQAEVSFAGLPAVQVDAVTDGGKKVVQQIYLVRGRSDGSATGYVITSLCPAAMEARYGALLKKARETLRFGD
jgi:hypothetical protein